MFETFSSIIRTSNRNSPRPDSDCLRGLSITTPPLVTLYYRLSKSLSFSPYSKSLFPARFLIRFIYFIQIWICETPFKCLVVSIPFLEYPMSSFLWVRCVSCSSVILCLGACLLLTILDCCPFTEQETIRRRFLPVSVPKRIQTPRDEVPRTNGGRARDRE